jgi:hypothetical protein
MVQAKSKRRVGQSILNFAASVLPDDPAAEVGKLVICMGGPFFRMTGEFSTRQFLMRAVRFDATTKWRAAKVPDGSMILRCEREAFSAEEGERYGWDIDADYPMNLVEWSRHRLLYRQQHPEPAPPPATAAANDGSNSALMALPVSDKRQGKRSKVWSYVTDIEKPQEFGGNTHTCNICNALLKQYGQSTDKLIQHFADFHEELHTDILRNSKHTKVQFDDEGNMVGKKYSFAEALPHHAKFVRWLIAHSKPFSTNTQKEFREFCSGLNNR